MQQSELQAAFITHFGQAPSFLVEAPGRVNLIGDHTDYNNLPVLPMALRQRVRLVVRPRDDDRVNVVPLAAGLESVSFTAGREVPSAAHGHWSNYARGAVQAVSRLGDGAASGFDAILASEVPIAAGLSSSSALVVAVTLAALQLRGLGLDPREVASLAAGAERFVGTQGGEMDHTVSACGMTGHALQIRFSPLRLTPLALPSNWRFIVAHSGEVAEKSGAREADYNARVRDCAKALEQLRGLEGVPPEATYPALVSAYPEAELMQMATGVLEGTILRRFRHTVTEAYRVDASVAALRDEDAVRFGTLMLASHESLAKDYEVSTERLDAMVSAAVEAGALGARLTGAGFGGSVVALALESTSPAVLSALTTTVSSFDRTKGVTAFTAIASDGAKVTHLRD